MNDFFVGQPSYSSPDVDNTGRVWLVSGKTREVIYSIDPPGAAWVFSGADGSLLYRLDNPKPQADGRFGSRIGRAGDLTGDGVPDSSNDSPAGCGQRSPQPGGCHVNQGQAFIFDGQDGRLVRTLNLPGRDRPRPSCSSDGDCGSFGIAVQGPGDIDGDGITDQLVGASSLDDGRGRMYVFSGKTGRLLHSISVPSDQPGAFFGFQDVAPLTPGDVNGDGFDDLYGNGFLQDGPAGEAEGKAWVFRRQDGRGALPARRPDAHRRRPVRVVSGEDRPQQRRDTGHLRRPIAAPTFPEPNRTVAPTSSTARMAACCRRWRFRPRTKIPRTTHGSGGASPHQGI
ncbi:MAG: hypothetical protein GEU83_10325 [Pseudonocardiaceae bacterium]|nr:hypothetical protein [Pseudonocardiaceae bacterium]